MKYRIYPRIETELAVLKDQPSTVRSRLIREAYTKAMKDWRGWIFFVALLLPCVVFLPSLVASPKSVWLSMLAGILPFGCLYISWWWTKWKLVPKHLRRLMVEHGIIICLKCGYDLRGSKDICPECGEEFGSTGVEG